MRIRYTKPAPKDFFDAEPTFKQLYYNIILYWLIYYDIYIYIYIYIYVYIYIHI